MGKSTEIQAHTDKYTLVGIVDPDTGEIKAVEGSEDTVTGMHLLQWVWDTGTMEWVKMQQPTIEAGDLYVALDDVEDKLDTLIAKDYATETTLADIKTATEKLDDIVDGNEAQVDIVSVTSVVSTANSTSTPLGIDGVFTGTSEDVRDYSGITISLFADQDSASDGLSVEFSTDGTNWDQVHAHSTIANTPHSITVGVRSRYFRLTFTNGGTGQSAFRLQVLFHTISPVGHIERLDGDVDSDTVAQMVRAVLTAKKPNNDFVNIEATAGGNLKTSVQEISDGLDIGAGNAGSETARVSISTDDVNLSAIKAAVEILDNIVAGNEAQVDVVSSALPSGAATEASLADQLLDYKIDDFDVSSDPVYIGYQDKGGNYYIKRVTLSTGAVDYSAGGSGYATAWTNRATESYNDFATEF